MNRFSTLKPAAGAHQDSNREPLVSWGLYMAVSPYLKTPPYVLDLLNLLEWVWTHYPRRFSTTSNKTRL